MLITHCPYNNNNNNNNNNNLIANGLSPGGSCYNACTWIWNKDLRTFKSGGLHDKHAVATLSLGSRLSIRF